MIINTIYFKHYKRWYDVFLKDEEQVAYISRLTELKAKIETQIKKKEFIEINGYANLFATRETTATPNNYLKIAKIVAAVIVFFVLSIVIGAIVIFFKHKYGLDQETLKFVTLVSTVMVVLIVLAFYKNKDEEFSEIIGRLVKLFVK